MCPPSDKIGLTYFNHFKITYKKQKDVFTTRIFLFHGAIKQILNLIMVPRKKMNVLHKDIITA